MTECECLLVDIESRHIITDLSPSDLWLFVGASWWSSVVRSTFLRRICSRVYIVVVSFFFFFFQAEDGIRDVAVTGVQTCALPICRSWSDSINASFGNRPQEIGLGR